MAFRFHYWARNTEGEKVQGDIEAADIDGARKKLMTDGLDVESIHVVFGSGAVGQTPAGPETVHPPKGAPAVSAADVRRVVPFFGAGLAVLVIFAVSPLFFKSCSSAPRAVDTSVRFNVVKFDDISDPGTVRKDFYITIAPQAGEEEIKYAARQVFDDDKQRVRNLEEAMFHFYYPTQDVNTHTAVAVLRWNWDGSGQWETSFSLERVKDKESVSIQRGEISGGESVAYKITLSPSISLDGARQVARSEMDRLKGQWQGKVKRIEADFIYEGYEDPFMKCALDLAAGGAAGLSCELMKQ